MKPCDHLGKNNKRDPSMKNIRSIHDVSTVLASTASWRSTILTQLGIPHQKQPPKFIEPSYTRGDPVKFIESMAFEKAKSLETDFPTSLIIAADQLVLFEGQLLGKPGTPEKALEQLQGLNGKTHQIITAVAVLFQGKVRMGHDKATLEMTSFSKQELQNYIERDQPWDCAGSYKIESLGGALFSKIQVEDLTTIIGLSGTLVVKFIRDFGFSPLL